MPVERPTAEDENQSPDGSVQDMLRALLLGEVRIRVDPLTGEILGEEGEIPPLTDQEGAHTIG